MFDRASRPSGTRPAAGIRTVVSAAALRVIDSAAKYPPRPFPIHLRPLQGLDFHVRNRRNLERPARPIGPPWPGRTDAGRDEAPGPRRLWTLELAGRCRRDGPAAPGRPLGARPAAALGSGWAGGDPLQRR